MTLSTVGLPLTEEGRLGTTLSPIRGRKISGLKSERSEQRNNSSSMRKSIEEADVAVSELC
jgi:hypothetical protein